MRHTLSNERTQGKQLNQLLKAGLRQKRQLTDNIYVVKGGGAGLVDTTMSKPKLRCKRSNWISPFAHPEACRDFKKQNLSLNACKNIERSFNVHHCLSLHSQLKPDKVYRLIKASQPQGEPIGDWPKFH